MPGVEARAEIFRPILGEVPEQIVETDSVSRWPIEMDARTFTEAVSIVLEYPVFGIVSEDKGYNILSEDKDYNVVSED